jgi:hypothetical protein
MNAGADTLTHGNLLIESRPAVRQVITLKETVLFAFKTSKNGSVSLCSYNAHLGLDHA